MGRRGSQRSLDVRNAAAGEHSDRIERIPIERIGKASARQCCRQSICPVRRLFGVNGHAATDWRIGREDDVAGHASVLRKWARSFIAGLDR
jgi:hypothetical protein